MTEQIKSTCLETVVCPRCGGTGEFSFNLRSGTRCFGCSGKGKKYTKRGAAALKFYKDMLKVAVRDLKAGDAFRDTFYCPNPVSKVVRIDCVELYVETKSGVVGLDGKVIPHECVLVVGVDHRNEPFSMKYEADLVVTRSVSKEERARLSNLTYEYQDKLTQNGVLAKKYQ